MSTSQTPNYGLHQWAGEDQFKRTDFNEDNAKLDAALHGLRSDVDAKAAQSALNTLTATVNGKADQTALTALIATVNGKASQSDLTALTTKVNAKAEQSALNALTTKVNAKAEQSALNALSATVSGKGNCRIVTGSYTGTGGYGQTTPNTLTFERTPLAVILAGEGVASTILVPPLTQIKVTQGLYLATWNVTWSGNRLSWYLSATSHASGASLTMFPEHQFNKDGAVYYYRVLLSAE